MGEMVASRSKKVLDYLADKNEFVYVMVQGDVEELGMALVKIEKLLNTESNSKKVMENMEKMRNLAYLIEDALETWAVLVQLSFMPNKNEMKGCIKAVVKRCFGSKDVVALLVKSIIVIKWSLDGELSLEWLHDTFPEEVLESERRGRIERRMANRRSLRWPKQMSSSSSSHGMEEHFVAMEKELNQLISLVHQHQVVSIWGVKGLGKTTLARKVYYDSQVRKRFDAFAWVSLDDQDYQVSSVLQDILNQLGAGAVKKSAEEQQKKDAKDYQRDLLNNMKKTSKRSAEEKKKGAEELQEEEKKQEATEEIGAAVKNKKKRDAKDFQKGVDLLLLEHKKDGAEEKKKGAEENGAGEEKKQEATEEIEKNKRAVQKSSEEKMMDELKETLKHKKCLIVIDGISEPTQWTDISSEFLMGDTNTKFLLTTDDEGETTDALGHPYQLRLLNEGEGWELLKKYAFNGKNTPDLGLAPIFGKEMVRTCDYLPSKISSLGRILSRKPLSEWHEVNDDVAGYLQKDYPNGKSYDVVNPSYDNLPYSQRQCFLYLAIFNKDEDVDPEDLLFLWMAEGMVSQEKEEASLMVTAKDDLRELAHRGLVHVQVDELSANRRFMPLSLRNSERDLSLCLGEKEDFRLQVMDFSGGKQHRFDSYILSNGTRRLAIHFDKLSSPAGEQNHVIAIGDLRSLFFLNSSRECAYLPMTIPDFNEFTLLRVLHFVRCKFKDRKLPEGIWKLLNLSYFGLLYCDLDKLPPSICNFRNLHVLNLRSYDDAKLTIPNVVSRMLGLKHLRLPPHSDCEQQSHKLKLEGLVDLETLVGFNVDKHDLGDPCELKNLQHLAAHASSNDSLESFVDKLGKFEKSDGSRIRINLLIEYKCDFTSTGLPLLQEVLMCPNIEALTFSMVVIHKFPNCGPHASSGLTQIKLVGCKLNEDPMEALGKFPSLRKLCFGYGAFVGSWMAISNAGFPKLDYLEFRCLPKLEGCSVDEGALQSLSAFTVKRCPKFYGIPLGLASVSSLENLDVELQPRAFQEWMSYSYKFYFVKSRNVRELDPLSAGSGSAH